MRYWDIVFIQGDEAYDILDKLCDARGIVVHGATDETLREAVDYLAQWDYGDESEHTLVTDESFGTYDARETVGEYVITYNYGLSYVGLVRIVNEDSDSLTRVGA